jgi:hypothetical protein
MMVIGLGIVLANLTENKKTSLLVKCVGPGLVMVGLTATLLRILFYMPYTCRKRGEIKKHKGKFEISDTKNGALNHGADVTNEEIFENNMLEKRSRKPTEQRFPPSVDLSNGTLSNDCSSLVC